MIKILKIVKISMVEFYGIWTKNINEIKCFDQNFYEY